MNKHVAAFLLFAMAITSTAFAANTPLSHQPKHFRNIMVVIFENMSYAEIKDEPTFKKLVEYSGNTLDSNGRLVKLFNPTPTLDSTGNGYAFFSHYYNDHGKDNEPSRPSQPNYIAMTSGSIHGIKDNDNHDIAADNIAIELMDAKLSWKVYADDLPDPKAAINRSSSSPDKTIAHMPPFVRDPAKSEAENDAAEQLAIEDFNQSHHLPSARDFNLSSGCFTGRSNNNGGGQPDDGYMRKHEPFISYKNIQNNRAYCKFIVNSSQLTNDLTHMPEVSFYIPNQINDGHNGTLEERTLHANAFLSAMMGTDPTTGDPMPDANNAPFQQFMAQDGLLVITFDEPSVTGNPDKTIYTILAGKMVHSGAYPTNGGNNAPTCYPADSKYTQCNHYNLLKLIETNWNLRGLYKKHTGAKYKAAYALDHKIKPLWR